MSYIEKHLLDSDEKIELNIKKNSIFIVLSWIWGILGFWLLLIPTFKAIKKTVEYATTEYAITKKKIIEKYGWISTHTDEMLLSKVENLTVTYTFWGKLFNYGTICIQGTNKNNVYFTYIKNADKVKKQISEIIYK